MTSPIRARCAAADLWGDRHMAIDRWYVVTDPEGHLFELCSAACLIEYATLGALPADVAIITQAGDGSESETAA